jgi:transposase InsO family protein
VGHVLRRHGLGRLPLLAPQPVVRRYERAHPGELVHMDTKALGRIAGVGHPSTATARPACAGSAGSTSTWCIDDASRLAYSEVLATNQQHDALGFLERAVAWFAARGVRIAGVMTDNGAAYRAWSWAAACTRLGLRRLRTRPYTPRTNGRPKRFIQTLLRGLSGKASPITAHAASISVGDIGRIPIPSIAQNFASKLRTVIRARGQLRTFSKCQRLFEVQYNTIPAGKA